MEIVNSQLNPATLEGVSPTKVSVVETKKVENTAVVVEKNNVVSDDAQNQTESIHEAVSRINDYVQNLQRSLQFTVDEESGKDVVTVLDKQTEEIIRQFPSEEVLQIARRIAEQKEGAINLFSSRI